MITARRASLARSRPALFLFLFTTLQFTHTLLADDPPQAVTVATYNLYNYRPTQENSSREEADYRATAEAIAELNADILCVQEMGKREDLVRLQEELRERGLDYPHISVVYAADYVRHLAILSKFKPAKVEHNTGAFYTIKGKHVPVRRGFVYARFEWGTYRLHLVGAHLKSKVYHELGQTDMRRYEARQLRYFVNQIAESEEGANILVLGDLNDSPDSSPVKSVVYRRYKYPKRMYDLRPVDTHNTGWTYYYAASDTYSRVDYAFASYSLLPEIDHSKSRIVQPTNWYQASDHRPLLIHIMPQEQEDPDRLQHFDNAIRRSAPAKPNDGPVVGTRKATRSE